MAIPASRTLKLTAIVVAVLVLLMWAASTGRPDAVAEGRSGDAAGAGSETPAFGETGPAVPLERVVISVTLLLGGGGLVFWLVRRFGGGRLASLALGGDRRMQLVDRLPLGGRRGLVIVRAAGRLLVLGVSEAGIQTVHDRPDPDSDQESFAGALERAAGEETP
jgi:flagellar biosynthetic protein FliO